MSNFWGAYQVHVLTRISTRTHEDKYDVLILIGVVSSKSPNGATLPQAKTNL